MSCVEAARRCPDAVFVSPHFELYGRVSGEIMDTLRTFADHLQPSGIAEGYLDVTLRSGGNFSRSHNLPREMKASIRQQHPLPTSTGIAPPMTAAEMAPAFGKPVRVDVV